MNPTGYTPAMIARALGVTPRTVRARLAGVRPGGRVTVAGNDAPTYGPYDLPAGLLADLVNAWHAAEAVTGATPWRNLTHFLSDPPPPATDAPLPTVSNPNAGWRGGDFDVLAAAAAALGEPGRPSAAEKANFWHLAFEAFESAVAAGTKARTFKRALERWIARHAPCMAFSERSWFRALSTWREAGRTPVALLDGRPAANAMRRVVVTIPQADQDRLLASSLKCHGGQVAPAWRELAARGPDNAGFSAATASRAGRDCPRQLQSLVAGRARELFPFQHQPRKASLNAAYIRRDWSEVAAGDWFSADDFTLEVYFYVPAEAGGWELTRGQLLLMIDERSQCILDFLLIPEKRYSGAHIRTLIIHVGLRLGLPRVGFHFERGIWEASKLVGGGVPWGEIETSMAARLGIRMSHSKPGNAKAKLVEGVGRLLQARLRRFPGWAGPNEQVFKVEKLQAAKLDVESGRVEPWKLGFKSFDEWRVTLAAECYAYNHTVQRSRVMGGNREVEMAPEDAWRTLQDDPPHLVNLRGSGAEHLLSHHFYQTRVTKYGIRRRHAGQDYVFTSEETGRIAGEPVKVFWSPDFPELIHVETVRKEIFTVTAQPMIPAHSATKEDFKAAARTVGAHNKAMLATVAALPHDFMPPARVNLPDPETAQRQTTIASAETAHREEQGRESRKAAQVAQLARRLGQRTPVLDAPSLDRQLEALRLLESAQNDNEPD